MKLDFLYIGPDKSGSTWIHESFDRHPDCFVPQKVKETFFFDRYYDRGFAWYQNFFKDCPPNVCAVGEVCHDYLFSQIAARRIKKNFPDIKLISCLRNPVERTFSQYLFLVRSGITREPFWQAVQKIPRLVDNSMYYKHLSFYYELFDKEQIKILLFEDLKTNPVQFANELFRSIGVAPMPDVVSQETALPASRPRSFYLARLTKAGANMARQLGMEWLVGRLKNSSYLTNLLYAAYDKTNKPELRKEEKKKLMEFFAKDIEKLEALLNINLSHWLNDEK